MCRALWAASCCRMPRPSCRAPMIITAIGMVIGKKSPISVASPMTAQQWATRAKPLHDERSARGAHSSAVKKSFGLTRVATAMAYVLLRPVRWAEHAREATEGEGDARSRRLCRQGAECPAEEGALPGHHPGSGEELRRARRSGGRPDRGDRARRQIQRRRDVLRAVAALVNPVDPRRAARVGSKLQRKTC